MSWTPATGRSSRAADASSADCARNNSDAWQATAADIAAARADNRDAARETSLSGIGKNGESTGPPNSLGEDGERSPRRGRSAAMCSLPTAADADAEERLSFGVAPQQAAAQLAACAASVLPRAALKEVGIAFGPRYVRSHDSVYRTVAQGLYPASGGIGGNPAGGPVLAPARHLPDPRAGAPA